MSEQSTVKGYGFVRGKLGEDGVVEKCAMYPYPHVCTPRWCSPPPEGHPLECPKCGSKQRASYRSACWTDTHEWHGGMKVPPVVAIPDNLAASPAPQPRCTDCDEAAKHAYSDATTPGFFSPYCEKHKPAAPQPEPTPLEIILSKRDQEAVVNSLMNPPEPNDNLKRLVAEQPSPPAGAREFTKDFFSTRMRNFREGSELPYLVAMELMEAYAKKERERAERAECMITQIQKDADDTAKVLMERSDAAERVNKEITRLGRELVDEVESLRTELRERTEARDEWIAEWNSANIKRATAERDMREALEHVIKHVTFSRNLCRDCAKAEALLSRKGEGS